MVIGHAAVVIGLAASVLAPPLAADARPAGKVYRIGLLGTTPPTAPGPRLWDALLQGLRELGYVEGRNLRIEGRYSDGRDERLPELAAELVRLEVDVIVAGATQPAHAAARATATIPVVMPNHSDPVGSGLVSGLARPGGNVTGLSILNPELVGKQLELLKEAVPQVVRVAVLWNPTHQAHPGMLKEAGAAAQALGLQLQALPAQSQADYAGAFAARPDRAAGGEESRRRVASWPTGPTCRTATGGRRPTWTRSSGAPGPPSSRSSNRRSSCS
jgi:putative ABC transport system substrate-binding protein